MSLINDEPEGLSTLYHDEAAWDDYDSQDQDLRRARWAAMVAGWALGQDDMVQKMLGPLPLAELIDLDASLTSLRDEVRQVVARRDAPRTRPSASPLKAAW